MTAKEIVRCGWAGKDALYCAYHDQEWGVPEHDDRALYEKLVLDGFQAGLSWITILRKRENFRKAFHNFEPEKIARYGTRDIDRLLKNEGIIRSRAKIEAAIRGARLWLEFQEKEPGGFLELIW
jgi:DNA-3-methyladenine glycosylase I